MHAGSKHRRIERIGLSIGIVLAVFLVLAVINSVLQSDQGPLEPTPEPTLQPTAGPTMEATPATPVISFDPEPPPPDGSLLHMLEYAPDRLRDNSLPLSDIAQYANIQKWMGSQGVELPGGPTDPEWENWEQQLSALALPEVLATRGTESTWITTYGFGLHQVHQVLAVGNAPDYVMVMLGDFDEEALTTTWAESGYQAVRVDGVTYWSLYPGGNVDLSAPASRPALGNMNNIVLLEDGTLIATSRADRMEQTIRVVQGNDPSLAENAQIESLLSLSIEPEHLVTAMLLQGTVLEELTVPGVEAAIATPVAEIPQASLVLAGLHLPAEEGGQATMFLVAAYNSAPDAVAMQHRASTMLAQDISRITEQPFADRVQPLSTRVIATGDNQQLLLFNLKLVHGASDWIEIVGSRDLGYLMWPRVP